MRITQLINSKGNPAANHFVITTDKGEYLQSYQSIVARIGQDGKITFGRDWDYSNTTLKHLKTFLDDDSSKKEFQKRIDNGEISIDYDLDIE